MSCVSCVSLDNESCVSCVSLDNESTDHLLSVDSLNCRITEIQNCHCPHLLPHKLFGIHHFSRQYHMLNITLSIQHNTFTLRKNNNIDMQAHAYITLGLLLSHRLTDSNVQKQVQTFHCFNLNITHQPLLCLCSETGPRACQSTRH